MARTISLRPRPSKARASSAIVVSLNALRTSGRFRVTVATLPSMTIFRVSNSMFSLSRSHAENAELRVRNFGVQRGRQAQAQHHAGVGRVDHAIVPQARGGVIRVALVFILLLDRLLEGG